MSRDPSRSLSRSIPRYRSIADQLRSSINACVLAPGVRLPSVRALAREHGVSVLTALEALRALEQDGVVEARPRSGYFVARRVNREDVQPVRPLELMPLDDMAELQLSLVGSPCRIRLDLANGEANLYPIDKLGMLMRQQVYRTPELLGSQVRGSGYPALKQQIARRAFDYGCNIDPRELMITNGCIESMSLSLRAVTRPGDCVIVESPTYFVILQMLRNLGLRAIEIPMNADGVDLPVLTRTLQARTVTAMLCIANVNNPFGCTMPMAHKQQLIELADQHDVTLIEDDIYGDTSFAAERPRPLRSLSDKVILCSSFSKTLAPGLRLGWVAAGKWSSAIASLKYASTNGTAIYPQAAVAEFLRTGGYDAHLRKLRKTLRQQTQQLRQVLLARFPAGTEVSNPTGGYVLWVKLPPGSASTRAVFERARKQSIGIAPGHLFGSAGRFDDCLRLNAGFGWNAEAASALDTLAGLVHPHSEN